MGRKQIAIAAVRRLGGALGGAIIGGALCSAASPYSQPWAWVHSIFSDFGSVFLACVGIGFCLPRTSNSVLEALFRYAAFGVGSLSLLRTVGWTAPIQAYICALGCVILAIVGPNWWGKAKYPEPHVPKRTESPEVLVSSLAAMKESK